MNTTKQLWPPNVPPSDARNHHDVRLRIVRSNISVSYQPYSIQIYDRGGIGVPTLFQAKDCSSTETEAYHTFNIFLESFEPWKGYHQRMNSLPVLHSSEKEERNLLIQLNSLQNLFTIVYYAKTSS